MRADVYIEAIADSICNLNEWTMDRLDIQLHKAGTTKWYCGYLYVSEIPDTIVIHDDGTFEKI